MNSKIRASRDIFLTFIIEFNIIFLICIRAGGGAGQAKEILNTHI